MQPHKPKTAWDSGTKSRHPKTRWLALALLPGAAVLGFAPLAVAQTVTWNGAESDSYADPDNWDAGVPGAGDDIIIDADPGAFLESGAFFGANLSVGALDYSVLEITGAGTSLTLSGDAVIGNNAFAGLYIDGGASFSAATLTAGGTSSGFGDILVSGANSHLQASSIVIGGADGGSSFLEVEDGAQVEADSLIFGVSYNSFAQSLITGDGTVVSADQIQIGVDSEGAWGGGSLVSVANGARLAATSGIELAHSPNSLGVLVIGMGFGSGEPGVIDTPIISMGAGYAQLVFFHTSDNYEFAPEIESAANGTIFVAMGQTTLTGISDNYDGLVAVSPDASLIVNGALSGDHIVQGLLGGSGTVGNVFIAYEGVLAPGNSIGTLTVDGDLEFDYGSIFEIETNASGASDAIIVTGDVLIDGGEVRLLAENGAYAPSTTYRIIEANEVDGAFDGVTSNFAFLNADLDYGVDYVDLILTRNGFSFADIARTPNQRNVAGAIESSGAGAVLYDTLLSASADEAQRAFETLASDLFAGIANRSAQDFLSFSSALNARLTQVAEAPRAFQLASAADTFSAPRGPNGAGFWATGFTSSGEIDSDGNYAELETERSGFALGADHAAAANASIGVAFGITETAYDVRSVSASAESTSYQLALYGGAQSGAYRLRGGIAYAYRTVGTERIAIVGAATQHLSADYESQGVQLFGEIGRGFEFEAAYVEPFVSASLIGQWTESFSETGGGAALSFDDADQTILSLVAGARGAFELSPTSNLYGSLGWRHAEGDTDEAANAALVSAPGQDFSLSGAPMEADTALIETGYRRDFGAASVMLTYDGELGDRASQHGVRLHYRLAL